MSKANRTQDSNVARFFVESALRGVWSWIVQKIHSAENQAHFIRNIPSLWDMRYAMADIQNMQCPMFISK